MLQEDSIKTLELIQDNCTGIATPETLLRDTYQLECAYYKLDNSPIAADVLDLLDKYFKAISSVNEVIVDVHVYDDDGLSDDLTEKIRNCGWTFKVYKLGGNGVWWEGLVYNCLPDLIYLAVSKSSIVV